MAAGMLFATSALRVEFAEAAPADSVSAKEEDASPGDKSAAKKISETVIVASRTEEDISAVSPAISKVSASEIRLRGHHSLVDSLQGQQGIAVAQSGATGAQTSLFVRGSKSNATALLLDGRRLNPGLSGSYEVARYTTDNLDSVQIARGPGGVLYGANTIGGVIDMRTVDPLAVRKNGGSSFVEAGSFGLLRSGVQIAGNSDNLAGTPSALRGLGASVGASVTDTQNKRGNNDFSQVSTTPRVAFRVTDSLSLDFVSQYSASRLGLPGSAGATGVYDPDDYQKDQGFLLSPGLRFDNGDDWKAQLFYSASDLRTEGLSSNSFGSSQYLYRARKDEVTAFAEYRPTRQGKLAAGYTHEDAYYSTNSSWVSVGNRTGQIRSDSPWVRATVYPLEDLSLGFGARHDDYDRFRGETTYDTFGSYRIASTETTIHGRVATSYTAPSPNDFTGGTLNQLRPEQSVSYETGLRQSLLSDKAHLGVTAYLNDFTDYIGFVEVPPGSWQYLSYNLDKARSSGLELSGDWTPERHVKFFANGELLRAHSRSDTAFAEQNGDRLVRRPDWTATAGLETYPDESWVIGFTATYVHGREDVGKKDLENYLLGRFYANWRANDWCEVFGRLENAFDARYQAAAGGFDALPFGAFGGVRLSF